MVGRKKGQKLLNDCLYSDRAEFLVVYGRRRVGKTYLIKEYFNNSFSFYATGLANAKTKEQLKVFNESLVECGGEDKKVPADWYDMFGKLKKFLQRECVRRDPVSGKRVIFLDELPWMDTARSDFKSALEYFWNSWASAQKDILLIVCGSATSWIIDNLLSDKGGFYNRVTRQMHLMPFTLNECRELFEENGVTMTKQQVIESYMVFGGIPYYLNCFDRRLSLAQNIDELLFKQTGQLYYEYDRLLGSLFKKWERHAAILTALSKKKGGMLRTELARITEIGDGAPLTKALNELEQCGFIRRYKNYVKEKSGMYFQLIDPFMLFCYQFIRNREHGSWMNYINTPGYYFWAGNAFEIVCLIHVDCIKKTLGISGVETNEYSWRSTMCAPGAQVDLIIDRKDGVVNVCEIKYTMTKYAIDAAYEDNLRNKIYAFVNETKCKKAVHLTFLSVSGLIKNSHSGIVQNEITGNDLFC